MNIIVTGSIAYDYLMTFPGRFQEHILPDQIANLSVSFLVDSMVRQRGGVATNIAYNLTLLNERPYVMGTVGQDFMEYRSWLEKQGVNTASIQTINDDFTASFFVSTDQENNQIAMFYTGAMAHAYTLSFKELAQTVLGGESIDLAVVSPNDPRAMVLYVDECKELGVPYLYDPSQQIVRLSGEQLRQGIQGARILTVNQYEFEMLREKTGLSHAEIAEQVEALIVTTGEQGSTIYSQQGTFEIPIVPPIRIVDPTGVGDAYRAGIIKGMVHNVPWELAGQLGAVAAAYVLEERGTQNHRYAWEEFANRFRQHFDDRGLLDTIGDYSPHSEPKE